MDDRDLFLLRSYYQLNAEHIDDHRAFGEGARRDVLRLLDELQKARNKLARLRTLQPTLPV